MNSQKKRWKESYHFVSNFLMYIKEWEPKRTLKKNPILALHGSRMQSGMWNSTAEKLKEWHFICPDQRGYGLSDAGSPRHPVSSKSFAKDALNLANKLKLDQFSLFGHSFGAAHVLHLASLIPKRIRCVVLVDVPSRPLEIRAKGLEENFAQPNSFKDLKSATKYFSKSENGDWPKKESLQFVKNLLLYNDLNGPCRMPFDKNWFFKLRTFQASIKSDYDPFPIAPLVKCPVLILRGGKTKRNTPKEVRKLKALLPTGTIIKTLKKSGHFPMVADLKNYEEVLREFLKKYAL